MTILKDRDLARWGREAREWLTHDDRGRTIGLVVLSLTVSIALSLMVTAIVGFASRRRAVAPGDALSADPGEPPAEVGQATAGSAGTPVMGEDVSVAATEPEEPVGA